MPSEEPKDGACGAEVKQTPDDMDIAYCENKAGFRTDHVGDGRCYLHGGASRSVNEGNTYNEKHGLYTNRQTYYENRTEAEQAWIDSIVESFLDDAPFGDDPPFAKLQMVRNIAIDMHKLQRANDYIDEKGVVHRDKTVGYTDDGKPIKMDEENVLNVSYDRLNRTMTRQLKELGILDDPDSQKAEAQADIASELSELRKQRGEE